MKTSTLSVIKASAAKLTEEQIRSLERSPDVAISTLEGIHSELAGLVDGVEKLRASGVDSMTTKLEEVFQRLDEAETEANLDLEAINFLHTEKRKETKTTNNRQRYVRHKHVSKMVIGGYPKDLAKQVVGLIESPSALDAAAAFDPSKTTLFTDSTEWGVQMLQNLSNFRKTQTVAAEEKTNATTKTLASKPPWGGCMVPWAHGDYDFDTWSLGKGKVEYSSHKGAAPWLVSCRQAHWRYGPWAWPFPGVGCFVQSLSPDSTEVFILVVPVTAVIKQGIAAKDMQTFMGTASGKKVLKEEVQVVKLQAGDSAALWVPYGHVALPLALADQKHEVGSKDSKDPALAHMWVFSPLSPALVKDVDEQVWTAIVAWNRDHIKRHGEQKTWADRGHVWESFLGKLQ